MAVRFNFNRENVFYPLVVQYVSAMVGFKELAGHAQVVRIRRKAEELGVSYEAALATLRRAGARLTDAAEQRTKFEVLPPFSLECTDFPRIDLDVDEIGEELLSEHEYHSQYLLVLAAGPMLITAYETCSHLGYVMDDPIWRFLRHCRNACAHGGRFSFRNSEPRRPASWGGLTITAAEQGRLLLPRDHKEPAFLKPGDPIRLLSSIEEKFPRLPTDPVLKAEQGARSTKA